MLADMSPPSHMVWIKFSNTVLPLSVLCYEHCFWDSIYQTIRTILRWVIQKGGKTNTPVSLICNESLNCLPASKNNKDPMFGGGGGRDGPWQNRGTTKHFRGTTKLFRGKTVVCHPSKNTWNLANLGKTCMYLVPLGSLMGFPDMSKCNNIVIYVIHRWNISFGFMWDPWIWGLTG